MGKVQDLRAKVKVPQGRWLPEYANLYICARNPMLYKRRSQHHQLCVLRMRPDVLDYPGVVIADGNASSSYTLFAPAPQGLERVDESLTFADNWTDPDLFTLWRQRRAKCAEVLVPDRVAPEFIMGAYVSCDESEQRLQELGVEFPVEVNAHLFFR